MSLTPRRQAIVPIAAFTASGQQSRLRAALAAGLDAGLTVNEIKEVLVQLYAYAGFPRSLNALAAFMAVLEQRRADGIDDPAGPEPSPPATGTTSLQVGTGHQTRLSGAPVTGPLFDFAPAIDTFLKAHLFGDIFGRDNLDWSSREIATVAALAALDGVDSQLQSHLRIAGNTGLTESDLRDLAAVLHDRVGPAPAARTTETLERL